MRRSARTILAASALTFLAAPAPAAPIESVIGSFALACMGDLTRGGSHREFEGGLASQGFSPLGGSEANAFVRSAGGSGGSAYATRFNDTGDSVIVAFDRDGACIFSSPDASRAGTEAFLLQTFGNDVRSARAATSTEAGIVDNTFALVVGGTRLFARFLGPGGAGGAVVWILPESQPPAAVAGTTVPWPQ